MTLWELADSWDGGYTAAVDHFLTCADFKCKACVAMACAQDLRNALANGATS